MLHKTENMINLKGRLKKQRIHLESSKHQSSYVSLDKEYDIWDI